MKTLLLRLSDEHGAFIKEASGYLLVSVAALALDLTVYWLLLGSVASATLPAAIGYSSGLFLHYALASRLVFANRHDGASLAAEAPTFVKYAATGVAGILMTSAIVGVCADVLGWSALTAKLLATICSFVAVFLARKFLVFGGAMNSAAAA